MRLEACYVGSSSVIPIRIWSTRPTITWPVFTRTRITSYNVCYTKLLRCRHNLNYWRRQPYLGIGAGAHSFFPDNWGSRWQIPNDLEHYQEALRNSTDPAQCLETFTRDSAMRETVYLVITSYSIHYTKLYESAGARLMVIRRVGNS